VSTEEGTGGFDPCHIIQKAILENNPNAELPACHFKAKEEKAEEKVEEDS